MGGRSVKCSFVSSDFCYLYSSGYISARRGGGEVGVDGNIRLHNPPRGIMNDSAGEFSTDYFEDFSIGLDNRAITLPTAKGGYLVALFLVNSRTSSNCSCVL